MSNLLNKTQIVAIEDERTYCQKCNNNYGYDEFDYRFDYPVCHKCVRKNQLTPEGE